MSNHKQTLPVVARARDDPDFQVDPNRRSTTNTIDWCSGCLQVPYHFPLKMWRISEIDMSCGPRIWCRVHWGLERRGLGAGNRKRWTVRASWLSGEFNVEENGYPRLFAWPVPSLAGLPHLKPNALSWRKCDTTSSRSTYSNQRPFPTLVVFPPFKHSKYSSFLNHNLSWKPRHLYSSNGSLQGRSFHK